MNKNSFYLAPLLSLMVIPSLCKDRYKKPNIIFILTDDQGYGDMHCNGNMDIITPNMDRFNDASVVFDDFHTSTVSAPSRSGLLSGKNCNATGVWHTIAGRSLLTTSLKLLPELLLNEGYSTAMFGKWHLGDDYPYRPQDRGFQVAFYNKGGGVGQTPDYWGNNYMNDCYFRMGVPERVKGYCTDVWFREAISYIDKNKDNKNPFFCYLATNAPHTPLNVERKYSDLYINNPNVVNPAFYGMITNLDENLGKLMSYLKTNKLLDNTIVIFMSDNGTYKGASFDKQGFVLKGFNAGMRGEKAKPYEGGHRVPFMIQIPGQAPKHIKSLASYTDLLPTLMDLCGLSKDIPKNIDGQSLLPYLKNDNSERCVVADNQSRELLVKYKDYCVMYKRWRLVNGKELYNLDYCCPLNTRSRFEPIVIQ